MEEMIWFPLTEKMEEWYGGFFLGNCAALGRKSSNISMDKGERDSVPGICNIWFIVSGVMVNRVSPNEETMALCLGR
jgi:hypothetical protein